MYSYAGSSAAAATVTPFSSPPETTNAAGAASQGGAVSQAAGTSSSAGVQSTLSQVVSTVPPTLQSLAAPVQTTPLEPGDITNFLSNLASSSFTPMSVAGITQVGADISVIRALSATAIPAAGAAGVGGEGIAAMGAVGPAGAASLGSAPVSAGIGRATLVGTMSVPQSWAAAAPATSPAAATSPTEGWYNPPGIEEVSSTGELPACRECRWRAAPADAAGVLPPHATGSNPPLSPVHRRPDSRQEPDRDLHARRSSYQTPTLAPTGAPSALYIMIHEQPQRISVDGRTPAVDAVARHARALS